MNLICVLLCGFAGACAVYTRADDAFTQDELAAAEKYKADTIAAIKKEIAALDKKRSAFVREKDVTSAMDLADKIRQQRTQLAASTRRSVAEYAMDLKRKREEEEAKIREEQDRLAQWRADAEANAKAAEAKAKADEQEEIQRRAQSGNCPLKLLSAGFFHLLHRNGITSDTTILGLVENRSGQPVDAYELVVEFLDGFDAVIDKHRLMGTRLPDGERGEIGAVVRHAEAAVQMRITIQRVRLQDGSLWERRPEHKHVEKLVKKMDGATIDARR